MPVVARRGGRGGIYGAEMAGGGGDVMCPTSDAAKKGKQYMFALLACLPVKGKHANTSPICSLFAPLVH